MSGRAASEPPYFLEGKAREEFASGEAASEIQLDSSPILSRLRHSLCTASLPKKKTFAHKIQPATQARFVEGLYFSTMSAFDDEFAGFLWTEALSGKKKSRIQKYPDRCEGGLKLPFNLRSSEKCLLTSVKTKSEKHC